MQSIYPLPAQTFNCPKPNTCINSCHAACTWTGSGSPSLDYCGGKCPWASQQECHPVYMDSGSVALIRCNGPLWACASFSSSSSKALDAGQACSTWLSPYNKKGMDSSQVDPQHPGLGPQALQQALAWHANISGKCVTCRIHKFQSCD